MWVTTPCVKETVRIKASCPLKRKHIETLTETSIYILNCMMNSINENTSASDIEQLYKSVEEFIRESKDDTSVLASFPIFEELKQKIKEYASLKTNEMHILARFLRFTLRLKKKYGAELQSSQGSLLLTLTFPLERGCDLYVQDFERGEIGKLILDVLLYPPYLICFDLHSEDLVIYLNDNELTAELKNVSPTPVKSPQDEPRLTATINTGYTPRSVSCLIDEQIWTCGFDKTMKLHNLQGELLSSIQTESGYIPGDIAVTREGYLVYTDIERNNVDLVKNKQIHTMIRLQGWTPRYMCNTITGDLLVTMVNDNATEFKVVRYSGSIETQTIQFDDQGRPLYSSDRYFTKYISENKNLDICVADWTAKAVVVVNHFGKFRFRYTGHSHSSKQSFRPHGITTDSHSHILTADINCIHILDQDGQFLLYIDKCGLHAPLSLCVDTRDNLFVAEWGTAEVKKIQYL